MSSCYAIGSLQSSPRLYSSEKKEGVDIARDIKKTGCLKEAVLLIESLKMQISLGSLSLKGAMVKIMRLIAILGYLEVDQDPMIINLLDDLKNFFESTYKVNFSSPEVKNGSLNSNSVQLHKDLILDSAQDSKYLDNELKPSLAPKIMESIGITDHKLIQEKSKVNHVKPVSVMPKPHFHVGYHINLKRPDKEGVKISLSYYKSPKVNPLEKIKSALSIVSKTSCIC